jgi:hypothetical protein
VADACRQEQAGCRLGHQRQVDEGRRQLCGIGEINQVAMQKHGRSDPDGEAGDASDDRLLGARQRIDEAVGERLALSRRYGGEVREVIAGGKCVALGTEEHDPGARIALDIVQRLGRRKVHGVRQRVLLLRPGEGDFEHRAVPSGLHVIRHADLLRLGLKPRPSPVIRRDRAAR